MLKKQIDCTSELKTPGEWNHVLTTTTFSRSGSHIWNIHVYTMLELSATYPLLTCVFACNIHQPYICWSKVLPFGTPAWSQRFARTPEIAKELTMPLWRTWNPCSVPTVRISWAMNRLNYCFTIFWWFLVQATTVCVVSSLRLVALFMNVVEQ